MQEWWSKNWDKVLTGLFSAALAGVIGFFSAIIATNEKIGTLRERIGTLEELKETVKEERAKTANSITAINNLSGRFDSMKDRVELAEVRVAAIKELTELQRQKTVNELEELLEKYGTMKLAK